MFFSCLVPVTDDIDGDSSNAIELGANETIESSLFTVKPLKQLARECIVRQLETIDTDDTETESEVSNASTGVEDDCFVGSIEAEETDEARVYSATSLKAIVLSTMQRFGICLEVPTLRNLCEAALPVVYILSDEDGLKASDSEPVLLCVGDEPEEGEVATEDESEDEDVVCIADEDTSTEPHSSPETEVICISDDEDAKSIDSKTTLEKEMDKIFFDDDDMPPTNDIQYEETVPSASGRQSFMIPIEPFKKYLQNKYVQTPNYFKMLIINRLLKKYVIYRRIFLMRKPKVVDRIRNLTRMRRRLTIAEKHEPKQIADSHTNGRSGGNHSKDSVHESPENGDSSDRGDKECPPKITEMPCDVLKQIAQKRTLKRKQSIHLPIDHSEDDYCYDDDRGISELLSSYINEGIESASAEKPRRSAEKCVRFEEPVSSQMEIDPNSFSLSPGEKVACEEPGSRRQSLPGILVNHHHPANPPKKLKVSFEEMLKDIDIAYRKRGSRLSTSSTSSSSSTCSKRSNSSTKRSWVDSQSSASSTSSDSSSDNGSADTLLQPPEVTPAPISYSLRPRIRKPIVDMADFDRQAMLCRRFSENIERKMKELQNQMSLAQQFNSNPTVRIYRIPAIDAMAKEYHSSVDRSYFHDNGRNNYYGRETFSNNSIKYRRKSHYDK